MCCAQTAAPEVKKAKRRKMQKRGYCWNKKHYVMKPSGGWWTGRGALSKKPPVLATIILTQLHGQMVSSELINWILLLRLSCCSSSHLLLLPPPCSLLPAPPPSPDLGLGKRLIGFWTLPH